MICKMVLLFHIYAINPTGDPAVLRFANGGYEAVIDGIPTPYFAGLEVRDWGIDHVGWEYKDGILWVDGVIDPLPDQLRVDNGDRRHDDLEDWDFRNARVEALYAFGDPRFLPLEMFSVYWTGTILRVEVDNYVAFYPRPATAVFDTDVHGPDEIMAGSGGEITIPAGATIKIDEDPELLPGEEFTIQIRVRSDVEGIYYRLADLIGVNHPWRILRHESGGGRYYLVVGHDPGGGVQYLYLPSDLVADGEPVWLTWTVDRSGRQTSWTNRSLYLSTTNVLGPSPAATQPIRLRGGPTKETHFSVFRIFDRALTDDEVLATVATPLSRDDWPALVVDLGFDAVSGTIVTDQTLNAHDGHAEGFTISAGSTYTGTRDQHGRVIPVFLGRIFGAEAVPIDPRLEVYRVAPVAVKDLQYVYDGGARRAPDQAEGVTYDFDPAARSIQIAQGGGGPVYGSILHRWVQGGEIEITGYNAGTVLVDEIIPSPFTATWPAAHRIRVADATGWTAGQGYSVLTGLNPGWQNLANVAGVFALTSRANKRITFDGIGDARIATEPPGPGLASAVHRAGNVAALLITAYGPKLSSEEFTAPGYDEFAESVGLWLPEPIEIRKPLERVLRAAQAGLVVDADGTMRLKRFVDPDVDPDPPVMTLGPRQISEIHRIKRPPIPDGLWIGYAERHTEHDEIPEGVDADTRAFFSEAFRWTEAPKGAGPRLGVKTPREETVLVEQGAAAELARDAYDRTRYGRLYRIILADWLPQYHQMLRWGAKVRIDPDHDPIADKKLRYFGEAVDVTVVGHKDYMAGDRYEIVVLQKQGGTS